MAKLYAELTSDKGGRVASKGGNEFISFTIYHGLTKVFHLEHGYESNQYTITEDTENAIIVLNDQQLT